VIAMIVLAALALAGLAAAIFLPANPEQRGASTKAIGPDALDTVTQHG
jgi:hypothetical protein